MWAEFSHLNKEVIQAEAELLICRIFANDASERRGCMGNVV